MAKSSVSPSESEGVKPRAAALVTWPSMSKDQRAWELAKVAVGTDDLHALIAKAQEYKEAL